MKQFVNQLPKVLDDVFDERIFSREIAVTMMAREVLK